MDRILPIGLVIAFLALTLPFRDFILDDAYITFRYAEHLAEGHGIVWNLGEAPVEGSSSMMWVLVTAAAHGLGLDVPLFAQIASLIAGAGAIITVWTVARRWGVGRWATVVACATMAMSPAFAFIALQGMETGLAGLLAVWAAALAVNVAERPSHGRLAGLMALLLAMVLTRPDLALYGAGLLAGLAWQVANHHGAKVHRRGLAWLVGGLLLPGLAYMVWRASYFGYPLPNTFYVKEGGSAAMLLIGAEKVVTFVLVVLGPLTVIALWRLVTDDRARDRFKRVLPVVAGVAVFLPMWFGISQIQGFLWRFQMPVLPAAALALGALIGELPSPRRAWRTRQRWAPRLVVLGLVGLLIAAPLSPYRAVGDAYRDRHQGDRAAVGQALAPFQAPDRSMFVTESGALPYYAGWTAIDHLGLNNETIAHHGLDQALLDRFDPELVMVLTQGRPGDMQDKRPILFHHLASRNYTLAAVTEKTHNPDAYHAYFLQEDARELEAITCAIRTADGVDTVDPPRFRRWMQLALPALADIDCA